MFISYIDEGDYNRRTARDDTLTRLRALESVLQLQSPRGTNLETLLLAEGLPTIPEVSMRPSTSTGTFTKFGASMTAAVLGISDSDSGKDDTFNVLSQPSLEREITSRRAAVVGEISYSDSVADDAVRTVPPSPERESTSQKTLAVRCQHRGLH